jgi:hypothetical protein
VALPPQKSLEARGDYPVSPTAWEGFQTNGVPLPQTAPTLGYNNGAGEPLAPNPPQPLPYLGGDVTLHAKGQPDWVEGPLHLLWGYDKLNGTVLVPTLQRARIVAGPLDEKTGGETVGTTIAINTSLLKESDYVIASVLAHEATHVRDNVQGLPNTKAACYTTEQSAFQINARVWQAFYGPQGDVLASTVWERDQNANLHDFLSNPDAARTVLVQNYQQECEAHSN